MHFTCALLGREVGSVLSTAGGDLGEFASALAVYEMVINQTLSQVTEHSK